MSIAEIRKKYPDYADMNDSDFATALHKKFYSDIPFKDFSKKVGLGPTLLPGTVLGGGKLTQIGPAPKPSLFRKALGLISPPKEPQMPMVYDLPEGRKYRTLPPTREEQPFKTLKNISEYYAARYISGLGMYTPDIIAHYTTGAKNFGEALNQETGFIPTRKEEQAGSFIEFMGGIKTATKAAGAVVGKIPVRALTQRIIGGMAAFGGRATAEEVSKRITEKDPISPTQIGLETAIGAGFGLLDATVARVKSEVAYRRFIKAHPEAKAYPKKLLLRANEAMSQWFRGLSKYIDKTGKIPIKKQPQVLRLAKRIQKMYGKDLDTLFGRMHGQTQTEAGLAIALKEKVGVSPEVADKAIEQLRKGVPVAEVDRALSMAKVLGKPAAEIAKITPEPPPTAIAPEIPPTIEGKDIGDFNTEEKAWLIRHKRALQKVLSAEKDRLAKLTTEERKLLEEDWEAFSRSKGYTAEEIQEYKDYVKSVEEGQALGFTEDFIFDIDRHSEMIWDLTGKVELAELEAQFSKLPAPTPAKPTVVAYRAGDLEAKVSTPPDLEGIYFADHKEMAKAYTELEGATAKEVKQYKIELKNPATEEIENQVARELGVPSGAADVEGLVTPYGLPLYDEQSAVKVAQELKKRGYDGVIRSNGEIVVFDKSSIAPTPAKPPTVEPTALEKSKLRRGIADVAVIGKVYKGLLNILEPAIPARQKIGRGPVTTVMRGTFGKRDRARVEFEQRHIETADKTTTQLERALDKYPKEVLDDLMLTRAHKKYMLTGEALKLQRRAYARLNKVAPELTKKKVREAIKAIADFNYKFLQDKTGLDEGYLFEDMHKAEDYFYGIYKPAKKGVTVSKFLEHWKTTDRYLKHKSIPTYNDAKAFGLEIRDPNPVRNLKTEYMDIAQRASMEWLKEELLRTGKGSYIDVADKAPVEWDIIGDQLRPEEAFKGYLLEPSLAKLINNLIATNKITKVPALNFFRQVNNVIRTVKFIGSAFHLKNIAKQSFADSGYFGVYKPTAYKGLTAGFRKDDPIFKTPEYLDYIELGGGHRYSVESEARKAFSDTVKKLTKSERMILKAGGLPFKIPVSFVDWMFNSYIPKVKYSKYLDLVGEKQKKLSRELMPAEKQEVIKEIQNFYGMMNERLFGRSGTVTTAMRFMFMAPGYAEGNYRTILKSALQWGDVKASRSRSNIVNSLAYSAIAATIGTLLFTGKPPKKPESAEEMRDLFKIDTGKKDKGGKPIMIDMLSYDKDYWNVYFNVLRGRPDIAVDKSFRRLGGMKAPLAQFATDLYQIAQGKAIYDFKEDKIYHLTDPFLQKVMKTVIHETQRIMPISASVFKRAKEKEIDEVLSVVAALTGTQLTTGERQIEEFKMIRDIWDMRDKREKLSYELNKYEDPWKAIEAYNNTIKKISEAKFATLELKNKAKALLIDPKKVVSWKRFPPEKLTTGQIIRAIQENTYKKPYRRDGVLYSRGQAHKGQEEHIKKLRVELARRRKK